jgi:porin
MPFKSHGHCPSGTRKAFWLVGAIATTALGWTMPSNSAIAQTYDKASRWDSLRSRPALLDGPGSPKQALRERGIDVQAWFTQFYQGVVSGEGDKDWQYGGKGDLVVGFDMSKLGLWDGLSVNVHQEWVYGEDANNQGNGALFPVNTALGFPRLGGYERDTSLVITQSLRDRLSISLGKFNMLDAAARKPLMGGGGLDTFMNTALAAPISGVTPPYLYGTISTLKTEHASYTLMVYDPRNAQDWKVIENPFTEGTTTSLSVTVPLKISGRQGFYGVRGVYSSQEGLDLASIPQLIDLPPAAERILTKTGYWYVNGTAYQYLYQDPDNPAIGWGFFASAAISDGNPNPIEWHVIGGLAGQGLFPGREQDRWGIGYFKYGLSDDLVTGLATIGSALQTDDPTFFIGDEQGVEVFYNMALTPWLRLTGNVQWIDPHEIQRDDTVVAAMRLQTRF